VQKSIHFQKASST